MKYYLPIIFFISTVLFILGSLWELNRHRKDGKFTGVSEGHFLILSWVIPEIFMFALLCSGALVDIMRSTDSFAGAGLFMLAPFYFLVVAVLNSSLYVIRKRNANVIYLSGLVVPVFSFLVFSIH